ncbi:hypothetical protein DT075_27660 [Bacillus licheniformis]|nr:hypothetical protein DT075_27660 [Bacillus licheniformis]
MAQEGKQAEVKKLFAKFGAKKLSEVPSEKYAELLKHAEALFALAEALAGVKVSSVKGAELRDSADVELRDALADALNTKEVVLDSKAAAQETEETPQVETPPTEDVIEINRKIQMTAFYPSAYE